MSRKYHRNSSLIKAMQKAVDQHADGQYAEAEKEYRAVIAVQPNNIEVNRLLGVVIGQQGRHEESLGYLRYAVGLAPRYAAAWSNLGAALHAYGDIDPAIQACDRAIDLDPMDYPARYTRGMCYLTKGDYQRGLQGYEAGLPSGIRSAWYSDVGRWRGGPLEEGKVLVIWWEQGFGDSIQFSRFLLNAKQWAGKATVVFEVQEDLYNLLKDVPGPDFVVKSVPGNVITHDYHCPLLSLPYIFGLRPDTIPSRPYLRAPMAHRWAGNVERYGGVPIGFQWRGSVKNVGMLSRHIPFEDMEPLLTGTKPCVWHSLEKGASQHDFTTFEDLAGLMANMEVIVTVDTAVAHLAGAMGMPTLLMLPYAADWRFSRVLGEETTPWYPTMKLYRQEKRDEWGPVIERVKNDLNKMVSEEIGYAIR